MAILLRGEVACWAEHYVWQQDMVLRLLIWNSIQFLLGTFSPLPGTLFYHFTMSTIHGSWTKMIIHFWIVFPME